MTDWWEEPYKSGLLVKVPGFPRPLYPPDAAERGKKPSADGPDVTAYKRTVCRAGRWGDWDPSSWDDTYSNAFAHGKGGNVADTGIAGVQRQQQIDDTGWLGKASFNMLRSILVPEGPHRGDPAMDSVAAKLIEQAWEMFGGHEPAPSTPDLVRVSALKRAISQLGVKESPSGSNRQKYGEWYGMNAVPWCAIFCTWAYELGASDVRKQAPSFIKGSRYSYVPYVVADARAGRYGLRTTDDPIPGDLVCYDWTGDGIHDHIGMFESWIVGTQTFNAIEGNTSVASDSNGGQVMRRARNQWQQGTVYVRVKEPA